MRIENLKRRTFVVQNGFFSEVELHDGIREIEIESVSISEDERKQLKNKSYSIVLKNGGKTINVIDWQDVKRILKN